MRLKTLRSWSFVGALVALALTFGAFLAIPAIAQEGSSLTIYKVNPDNHALSGASFELFPLGSSTPATAPVVTDSTGHATFEGLADGKYTLHEIAAPSGYAAAADIVVDIPAQNQQFVMDSFATGGGSLEIFKASTNAPTKGLAGARFTAKNEQTGAVFTLDYTDQGGFVTWTVPAGSYTVHETIAPQGFAPAPDMTGVLVFAGKTTDITVLDSGGGGVEGTGLSSLTVYKVNPDNQALAGATFVLMPLGSSTVAYGPVVTDSSGHGTFNGVVPGKYTLHETIAPPGYSAASDIVVDIGVSPAQQFVMDRFAAGNGSLEIFKASAAAPSKGLAGARFSATNEQTGAVFTLDYTDQGGFVTWTVPAGSYTVHETIAPQGFAPAPDMTGVVVLAGQTTDITVLDQAGGTGGVSGQGTSSLTVYKVNQDNQALAGASFVLMPLGSSTVAYGPMVTDGTGHAVFTGVVPGKYTLHETTAPPGYTASADIVVDVGSNPAQQFVKDQLISSTTTTTTTTENTNANNTNAATANTSVASARLATTGGGQALRLWLLAFAGLQSVGIGLALMFRKPQLRRASN